MTLAQAIELIETTHAAMSRDYKCAVFDEYAIVWRKGRKEYLVWYRGPREAEFIKTFGNDTAPLQAEAAAQPTRVYHIGDFQFTAEGHGSQSEAFVVVGDELRLVCGNTRLSMAEISQNRLWLAAQQHFVYMSERFAVDPLVWNPNLASNTQP